VDPAREPSAAPRSTRARRKASARSTAGERGMRSPSCRPYSRGELRCLRAPLRTACRASRDRPRLLYDRRAPATSPSIRCACPSNRATRGLAAWLNRANRRSPVIAWRA
jgi:hypothetical protein